MKFLRIEFFLALILFAILTSLLIFLLDKQVKLDSSYKIEIERYEQIIQELSNKSQALELDLKLYYTQIDSLNIELSTIKNSFNFLQTNLDENINNINNLSVLELTCFFASRYSQYRHLFTSADCSTSSP